MKTVGVLGTGTMGAGIIQVLAQNGYNVVLRARRQTSVDRGIATVEKNLDRLIKKEKITEADKAEIMGDVYKRQRYHLRSGGAETYRRIQEV